MQGVYLVRKEILAFGNGVKPEYESELLFLLGSLRHENIVELLVSYTQAGVPNLLFAPADLDLHDFLQLESRMAGFEENAVVIKGLHGLSSGLEYLHNFRPRFQNLGEAKVSMYGYHHDIKPRNVLVKANKFILADFGLSKLKNVGENTTTDWKDTTYEYGAPECRNPDNFAPGKVGRALDIWSLSCVFSEVAIYLETGAVGVLEFRENRLIDNIYGKTRCFHDNTALSSQVDSYLTVLVEKASFELTKDLVELVREMFVTNPQDRPKAQKVDVKMAQLSLSAFMYSLRQILEDRIRDITSLNDSKTFRARLVLERNRLSAWAGVIGLMPVAGHTYASKHITLALFPAMMHVLQSTISDLKIFQRFDSIQDDHDFIISTMHHTNKSLCDHLPDQIKTSIDDVFAILSTMVSELQPLASIESATMAESAPQYKDVGAVAAMKYMSILLSSQNRIVVVNPPISPALIRRDSHEDDFQVCPQTFWYSYGYQPDEERKVLIEWKGYGTQWTKRIKSKEFEKIGESVFIRIQELVEMLKFKPKPSNFRVLDCLGAFHDTKRCEFGIVYGFPSEATTPVRLQRLLRRKKIQEVFPDPSQKLALAKALVASIHIFHVSGWIHKNLDSYNVLFFCTWKGGWKDLDYGKPYVVGFNHSRRDGPLEYTEGPDYPTSQKEYQHPRYRDGSSTYQKVFDCYSLGLILLEVGTWNSLSNFYDRYPTYSPLELKEEYLRFCKQELRMIMGKAYSEVTESCLRSDDGFGEVKGCTDLDFQEVVQKLQSCVF